MVFFRRSCLCLVMWLLLLGTALAGQKYSLTILHTNDMHAHVGPIDPMGALCDQAADAAGKCQGGAARLATAIAQERAKGDPTLLLDAGDQFQGTLYFTLFKGEPMAMVMNRLGYDAMTLGNHEFDDGPATLAAFIKALRFPVVAANLDVAASPELRKLIVPGTISTVAGRKIGIVGLALPKTAEVSSPGPGIVFDKAVPAVTKAVADVKRKGASIVILVSHADFEADKKLAASVPDIDVIISGHSHILLSNNAPEAVGPSPLVVPHAGGAPTLIVSTGAWGRYLGVLHLTFDAAGKIVAYVGNPVRLDAGVPEDPAMVKALVHYTDAVMALKKDVLTKSDAALDAASCQQGECQLGNFLAEAMLAAAKPEGAVAALVESGLIRAGLPAGEVTRYDVLTAFSRPATLVTVTLTGEHIKDLLEQGLSASGGKSAGGRLLQVAGLRYGYDPDKAAGSRVTDVQIADANGWFADIQPEVAYRVAIPSDMARDGKGFDVRKDGRDPKDSGQSLADIAAQGIKTQTPPIPALDDRIQREAGKK